MLCDSLGCVIMDELQHSIIREQYNQNCETIEENKDKVKNKIAQNALIEDRTSI
jgi:hypothetical protein